VLVRAFDRRHMMELARLDLAGSVRELYESAVVLGREALQAVGVSEGYAEKIEAEYRRRDGIRLEAQLATGDLTSGREGMFTPDRKLDLEDLE
jgi:glutathione-regulated potassium-efflux system protein KefB